MPKIELWSNFPSALRQHLIERMRDRSITLADLNQLRLWIESDPEVPDDEWYKDFGSFKLCGEGRYPKTFLLAGQQIEEQSYSGAEKYARSPLDSLQCARSCSP